MGETDMSGNECHLEASAVRLKNKKILLISLVEIAYKENIRLYKKLEKLA